MVLASGRFARRARGQAGITYTWETSVLTLEWPLFLILAISLSVLLGVLGGYLSARAAVIGSERRLNRSLASRTAHVQ